MEKSIINVLDVNKMGLEGSAEFAEKMLDTLFKTIIKRPEAISAEDCESYFEYYDGLIETFLNTESHDRI